MKKRIEFSRDLYNAIPPDREHMFIKRKKFNEIKTSIIRESGFTRRE